MRMLLDMFLMTLTLGEFIDLDFQINEFVKFRTRLQNSLQYSCATAERMLLDLVLETNSHLSTEQMVMYMEINPEKGKSKYTVFI